MVLSSMSSAGVGFGPGDEYWDPKEVTFVVEVAIIAAVERLSVRARFRQEVVVRDVSLKALENKR